MSKNIEQMNVVYIAENITNRGEINIFNKSLEQETNKRSELFIDELKAIFKNVFYYNSPEEFALNIDNHKHDLIFPNWYGKSSRSRLTLIPALCEIHNLDYIGSSVYANSLCTDKYLTKLYVESFDIKTAYSVLIHSIQSLDQNKNLNNLNFPVIVKPNYEGSSIGIDKSSICYTVDETINQVNKLFTNFKDSILIEEYVKGEEIEIFVFGNKNSITIFEAFQNIIDGKKYFNDEILDVYSKFVTENYDEIIYIKPIEELCEKIKKVFFSFDKIEFARFDFRINESGAYLIELSTDCAIGPDCIPNKAFEKNGYDFREMLTLLSKNALLKN